MTEGNGQTVGPQLSVLDVSAGPVQTAPQRGAGESQARVRVRVEPAAQVVEHGVVTAHSLQAP